MYLCRGGNAAAASVISIMVNMSETAPLHKLEQSVSLALRKYLPASARRLAIAVSGGADSTALLTALCRLGYGSRLLALHCNFHLRGAESDRDQQAVTSLCHNAGVEVRVRHCDVDRYRREHGGSIEMACRELRYDWFASQLAPDDMLLTAHNADDRIETLLFNLFRGTGLPGLRSVRPLRDGKLLRPMLDVSRREVLDYLQSLGVDYVTDSSNLSTQFARNRIRLEVLPVIDATHPHARTGITTTIRALSATEALYQSLLDAERQRHLTADGGIDVSGLLSGPHASSSVQMLFEWFRPEGISMDTAQRIVASASLPGTRRFIIGGKVWVLRSGQLYPSANTSPADSEHPVSELFELTLLPRSDSGFDTCRQPGTAYFDSSLLDHTLTARFRRDGDRFRPFGLRGSKLLSDLFTDLHVPADLRDSVPLLLADDRIVNVGDLRQSSFCPVTPRTLDIVEVRVRRGAIRS